jgi:hypothetical protein
MSLDLDYVDKIRSSDLKNLLREKLNGYLSNPQVDHGNTDARREALGIQPTPVAQPAPI